MLFFQNMEYLGSEVDDDLEEQFYLQRLEAGLFTLQLVDYIMLEISVNGPPGVSRRQFTGEMHAIPQYIIIRYYNICDQC